MEAVFDGNWLIKAFYEVTQGDRSPALDPELTASRALMPAFDKPQRTGLTQLLMANANMLATLGQNNVWMHFHRRLHSHVRRLWADPQYESFSKEERQAHKLKIGRIVSEMTRAPTADIAEDVARERTRLGIDEAVGDWKDKPLLYHLKANPHRFLHAMSIMSRDAEAGGGRAFALFPLRRCMVPRHIRIDKKSLQEMLQAGRNERLGRKRKQRGDCDFLFDTVLDYKRADIRTTKQWAIKDGFTTDGVCARVQQVRAPPSDSQRREARTLGSRGLWAIDELKRVARLDQLQVVGIDPGKRELVVAVDQATGAMVRYTQRERLKDLRSRQYRDEMEREKPGDVMVAEEELSATNSRTADVCAFQTYVAHRQRHLDCCLAYYSRLDHRHRRWKTYIKAQQSEEKLYRKLRGLRTGTETLVLAYGSWGLVAGRPSVACKGNPPCIGSGLMKKLSKRFVVVPTPEQYTSKTCCKCLQPCGPWLEVEQRMGRRIRGLRICQNDACSLPQNRDRTGASNIATQFSRLFRGMGPIRSLTAMEEELHRHDLCLHCDD